MQRKMQRKQGAQKGPIVLPLMAIMAAAVLCLGALVGCAGSDQGTAAKFDGHSILEDEVTEYTAEFRAQNGLSNDTDWAAYLQGNALTGKTWRERAIRTLAERLLVQDKAKELGISANADDVSKQVAEAKQRAGVAEGDDAGWSSYLSSRGTTPERFEENCEFTSVEEQVMRKELNFDDQLEAQMCDDYIKQNLADRVVRRYSAIVLERNKTGKAEGEKLLGQLKGLSGDELESKFAELAKANSTDSASAHAGGDIGWDFTYSEGTIDPKAEVRYSKLKAGELYPKLVRGSDAYRIMLCTGVVNFEDTPRFSQLPDASSSTIRAVIEQLALATTWAAKCQEYLDNLVNSANVQVSEMPSGLSYDIVGDDGDEGAAADSATPASSDAAGMADGQ